MLSQNLITVLLFLAARYEYFRVGALGHKSLGQTLLNFIVQ
jgi:hypothetical protein